MSEETDVIDADKRSMLKRKAVIWGSALVVVVWFFFWGVPINYMKSALTVLAIMAGVSITVCFFMTYFAIRFLLFPSKKDNPYEGYIIFAIIMVVFFGSCVLMIFAETNREQHELEKYGQIAMAKVVDGSSFATRRIDLTSVKLVFTMANGEEYTVDESVSHVNFDMFYQGQEIPVIYSTEHPTILEILYRREELNKYKKLISDRKK
jgi:hypothetical protein